MQENSYNQLLPHSEEIEEAVLGAVLLEQDALMQVEELLRPELFYDRRRAIIMEAILELSRSHLPIDLLTVSNKIKSMTLLDEIGGMYYLTQIVNRIGSAANIEYHAKLLVQFHIKRNAIIELQTTLAKIMHTEDAFDVVDNVEQMCERVSEGKDRLSKQKDVTEVLKSVVDDYHYRKKAANSIGLTGVPTGFNELDRMTKGWKEGKLIYVAGRPSMGKTSLSVHFAQAALKENIPTAYFSLEVEASEIITKMVLSYDIEAEKYDNVALSQDEESRMYNAVDIIDKYPLYIYDDVFALSDIIAKIKTLKRKHGVKVVFIDYIGLIEVSSNKKINNRENEISYISRQLKQIAKVCKIPIIALSQLNRAVESRTNKRPMMSDMRDSGSLEQDADIVIMPYRDVYYYADTEHKNRGEMLVTKNRNGATGTVFFWHNKELTKCADWKGSTIVPDHTESVNILNPTEIGF